MRDAAAFRRLLAAALVAAAALPPEVVRRGPTLCAFRAVTGRPCPSCGLTRSWNALGHGRVREAVGFHSMGPATFVAAVVMVAAGDRRVAQALSPGGRLRPLFGTFVAAWIGAWLWRLWKGA